MIVDLDQMLLEQVAEVVLVQQAVLLVHLLEVQQEQAELELLHLFQDHLFKEQEVAVVVPKQGQVPLVILLEVLVLVAEVLEVKQLLLQDIVDQLEMELLILVVAVVEMVVLLIQTQVLAELVDLV